ncbi:MAG: hypothetical protein HKO85_05705 [Xanthomonadales bacterium]|nr:hypothetical protein [Gammaproteobacteria bacterium]NNJ77961.1 hypothetical protein [Xanthomonadales bacterium]NNL04762.1 hypothetical protein [Xanthomonadales bacterium]
MPQSIRSMFVFAVLSVFLAAPLAAQDAPHRLSEMWTMVPKADQSKDFYDGLKAHMEMRAELGDPRTWDAYTPMLGDELNIVGVRSCCFNWADMDAYRKWSEENSAVNDHFQSHVAPHVESYAHYIDEISWVNSNWKSDWGPYRFFGATQFKLKPGHAGTFDAARDKISQIAINQGWATEEHPWIWSRQVGSLTESIVVPYRNFADMEPGEQNFFDFLSNVLGSDEAADALFKDLTSGVEEQSYQIWELNESLSMDR